MNIFNKVVPWFIPTKKDQTRWYKEELLDTPKEVHRILKDFQKISSEYNIRLGDFESRLATTPMYEEYLQIKRLAQETNFLWNHLEYKQEREKELQKILLDITN